MFRLARRQEVARNSSTSKRELVKACVLPMGAKITSRCVCIQHHLELHVSNLCMLCIPKLLSMHARPVLFKTTSLNLVPAIKQNCLRLSVRSQTMIGLLQELFMQVAVDGKDDRSIYSMLMAALVRSHCTCQVSVSTIRATAVAA